MEAIEKILSDAIDREVEAYQFYQQVYERVDDPTVKEVFERLAKEEQGHREMLEQFKHDPTMVMQIQPPPADYKVAEATELPKLSIEMKPADAIALAMKKEQQAVELYRALGEGATDPKVKSIFENLANMELGHKHRLENVFVQIGYPEVF
jgi:rubrerythrin